MDFLALAQSRYTAKKYNAEKKVSNEQIEKLKEILRLSPSSINSQPWQFLFIETAELRNQLAEVSFFNEEKIKAAGNLVVFTVIDDVELFEQQIKENLPEGAVDYYNRVVKPQGEAAIKAWMQHQVYLSLGFFLSACAAAGLDSTPMEGINAAAYDKILKLDGYKTLFAVAIGHAADDDYNRLDVQPKRRLPIEKVVRTL